MSSKPDNQKKYNEDILCIPANLVEDIEGYVAKERSLIEFDRLLDRFDDNTFFVSRDYAETNEKYKQIIPYIYIVCKGEDGLYYYLTAQRTKLGGESRLFGKRTCGFAGHINTTDILSDTDTWRDILENGIDRETDEELGFSAEYRYWGKRGLINTNMDAVSKVHVGIVIEMQIKKFSHIELLDPNLMNCEWLNKTQMFERLEEFETWSQILINYVNQPKKQDW